MPRLAETYRWLCGETRAQSKGDQTMPEYERYTHHGHEVVVRSDLKGRHQDHCLCWQCARFNPGPPETNCPTANLLYGVCIAQGITAPVWECGAFLERADGTIDEVCGG